VIMRDEKTRKKNTTGRSRLGRYSLIFFISAWMFILGVLVGRGTAPVQFDMEKLEKELAALRKTVSESNENRYKIVYPPVEKGGGGLDFHEALKKKGDGADATLPPKAVRQHIAAKEQGTRAAAQAPQSAAAPAQSESKTAAAPGEQGGKTTPPVSPKSGAFTIQVAAVKSLQVAREEVAKLSGMGYDAYTVTVTIPGKGTWHRIRIGAFEKKSDAAAVLSKMAKKKIDGIIVQR
jgi:cell division septation protein DedD